MKHLLKLNCKAQETQVTKKYELDPSKLLPIRFCPISLDFQHLLEPSGVIPFHISLGFCAALGQVRKEKSDISVCWKSWVIPQQ